MHIPALFKLGADAQRIARTLGHRAAAGFLRNRGVSCEAALFILFGRV